MSIISIFWHGAKNYMHHCTKFEENWSMHFWEITPDGSHWSGMIKKIEINHFIFTDVSIATAVKIPQILPDLDQDFKI